MYYLLFVAATCTIGCSEDLWEDDILRTKSSDNGEYLDLKTYDYREWTEREILIMGIAESRMNVLFKNNKYVIQAKNGAEINVSESLFNLVKSQLEHTNIILNSRDRRIVRTKNNNPESSSGLPNCVPVAISHMGQDAPSYDDAVAQCNIFHPTWVQDGGVYSSLVGPIIRVFTSVTTRLNMNSYSIVTNLNNCVLLLPQGGNIDHAVNAIYYDPNYDMLNIKRIIYVDYSGGGTGTTGRVDPSQMTTIYTFD